MSNYLVVAYQTADSMELIDTVGGIADRDSSAQFVLLVPATRMEELRSHVESDRRANAERIATKAIYKYNDAGVRFLRVSVGDESPVVAIQDEISSRPDFYSEVIISTLPVDFSKWLEMDVPRKIRETFGLPVTHVYGGVTTME